MDFNMSDRQREWLDRVESFMHKHVRPAVPIYKQQDAEGARWKTIPGAGRSEKEGAGRGPVEHVHAALERTRTTNSAVRD